MERFRPSPGGYYPYQVRRENDVDLAAWLAFRQITRLSAKLRHPYHARGALEFEDVACRLA